MSHEHLRTTRTPPDQSKCPRCGAVSPTCYGTVDPDQPGVEVEVCRDGVLVFRVLICDPCWTKLRGRDSA